MSEHVLILSSKDAKDKAERRRMDYNEFRPHSAALTGHELNSLEIGLRSRMSIIYTLQNGLLWGRLNITNSLFDAAYQILISTASTPLRQVDTDRQTGYHTPEPDVR